MENHQIEIAEEKKDDASIGTEKVSLEFRGDPSLMIPISPTLRCGEEWTGVDCNDDEDEDEDNRGPITFHIAVPGTSIEDTDGENQKLTFYSRDRSSGVLLPSEPSVPQIALDGRVHPFFFEPGFGLEAGTGFQVWPGSRLMVEQLVLNPSLFGDKPTKNILEVGAGIGVVGTCLAASGNHVLVTDLSVLVKYGIRPNLRRNRNPNRPTEEQPPSFLANYENDEEYYDTTPVPIGKGWATAAPLDWLSPLSPQITQDSTNSIDLIVGCDCLFLRKLIDPLLSIVADVWEEHKMTPPPFLFTYERRNMLGLFITLEDLLEKIKARGWRVECLVWRTIPVEGDGEHDLYLFRITPV